MDEMQAKAMAYTESKSAILDQAYSEILKFLPEKLLQQEADS